MRLCFFADASNVHTKRWARYFAGKGYDVHIITPIVSVGEDISDITIHKIPYFHSLDTIILNICYIKYLLRVIKPDILHGIFLSNCAFYASLLGFQPFVSTALGSDVLVAPKKLIRRYWQVKYVLRHSSVITVDAEILKYELIRMGFSEEKIEMILFGVESSVLSTKKRKQSLKILSCRNLNPLYNIDIIIKAFASIKKDLKEGCLTIVGDISKFPKIFIDDPKIEYQQPMEHRDLMQFMADFEIFVSVPSSDGSSVSLLEAMALGLFPIVTDLPANREWIKDGYNGFLVPPRNAYILGKKIIEAARNSRLRKEAALINHRIIKKKAIFEKNMEKLEKIYNSLLRK